MALRAYDEALRAAGHEPITTEVEPAAPFYYAEDYHQQYLHKVPNGYCGLAGTGVSCRIPRLEQPRRVRIPSRAGDPLLRLLHRRLPCRDRHRLRGRPRRLLAAALDRARVLGRAGAPRRRDDRLRPADPLPRSCSARSASSPSAGRSLVCIAVGLLAAWHRLAQGAPESREVAAPRVQMIVLLLAVGVASFTVAEWTFPSQLSLDKGMFGGDTTWYHMPFSGADRPGRVDGPPALHRPAAARRLVLPAELRARPRRRHRPLQERLALAAAQPRLALDRPARRLVRRPPLQGRPGDPGRRRDRPRRGGDDRDPARRGAQRHHGPRLPARLRRLPDQRPPAKGPGRGGRGPGHPRARRPPARQGPAGARRRRRRPRRLGQVHLPDPGRRDRRRRRLLQRQGPAADDGLGRWGSRPSSSAATGT